MSIRTVSPSLTSARAPPLAASGEMCPIDSPEVPPENRPSVTSAQARPSPLPLRKLVGDSISCLPGPPPGDPGDGAPLRLEHLRGAGERPQLLGHARGLHHRPLGGDVPVEHAEPA